VPQFTAVYVPGPISLSLDPFTGINGTAVFERGAVELSIDNQQYGYSNGSSFSLYYNVRVRNPADDGGIWHVLFPTIKLFPESGIFTINDYGNYTADYISGVNINNPVLPQSSTNRTTVYIPIPSPNTTYVVVPSLDAWTNPASSQMEIQVEAMVGVNSTHYIPDNSIVNAGGNYYPAVVYVTSSDWSSSQIITISDNTTIISPSASATPSPSNLLSVYPTVTPNTSGPQTLAFFGLDWFQIAIVVLLGVVVVLLVFVVVFLRRRTVK
jgi:hypothetical protein